MFAVFVIVLATGCATQGGSVPNNLRSELASTSTALATVTSFAAPSANYTYPREAARATDAFVDFIGVNTHFTYAGEVYDSASAENALVTLGVRHIRDGPTTTPGLVNHYTNLMAHGVHLDAAWGINNFSGPVSLWSVQPDVFAATVGVEHLDSYEGTNEPNFACTHNTNWVSQVTAQQSALWNFMRSSSSLRTLPLLAPSYGNCGAWASLISDANTMGSGVAPYSSFANSHPYAGRSIPEAGSYISAQATGTVSPNNYQGAAQIEVPGKPVVVTEAGYGSNTSASDNGVGLVGQERYTLRELFNFWNNGVKRVYIYQLIENTNGSESYGLMNLQLVPNPAYRALKNLIAILSDPGPTFTPTALSYTLARSTTFNHVLLERRNGTFELILWQPVPSVDSNGNSLAIAPQTATLTFETTPTSIKAHTFTDTGDLLPISVTIAGRQVSVPVTDVPVVVHISL